MSRIQRDTVGALIEELKATVGHHGMCVGADEGFHELCEIQKIKTVGHPPEAPQLRAVDCEPDEIRTPRPYIERNREIVKSVVVLIGAPRELIEPRILRGHGTWSTIHHAMGQIPVYVVKANGTTQRR